MAKLEPIIVKVDISDCREILRMLYGAIEELQKENEELKDRITDLEGLSLHS